MKTLLRLIRGAYCHLFAWCDYPTSEQRLRGIYRLGKFEGRREALRDLPIVQVQPRQPTISTILHLPPGEWSRQYRQMTGQLTPIDVKHMTPEQIAAVPTIRDLKETPLLKNLLDDENTEEMQATVALLHQKREQRRQAG